MADKPSSGPVLTRLMVNSADRKSGQPGQANFSLTPPYTDINKLKVLMVELRQRFIPNPLAKVWVAMHPDSPCHFGASRETEWTSDNSTAISQFADASFNLPWIWGGLNNASTERLSAAILRKRKQPPGDVIAPLSAEADPDIANPGESKIYETFTIDVKPRRWSEVLATCLTLAVNSVMQNFGMSIHQAALDKDGKAPIAPENNSYLFYTPTLEAPATHVIPFAAFKNVEPVYRPKPIWNPATNRGADPSVATMAFHALAPGESRTVKHFFDAIIQPPDEIDPETGEPIEPPPPTWTDTGVCVPTDMSNPSATHFQFRFWNTVKDGGSQKYQFPDGATRVAPYSRCIPWMRFRVDSRDIAESLGLEWVSQSWIGGAGYGEFTVKGPDTDNSYAAIIATGDDKFLSPYSMSPNPALENLPYVLFKSDELTMSRGHRSTNSRETNVLVKVLLQGETNSEVSMVDDTADWLGTSGNTIADFTVTVTDPWGMPFTIPSNIDEDFQRRIGESYVDDGISARLANVRHRMSPWTLTLGLERCGCGPKLGADEYVARRARLEGLM